MLAWELHEELPSRGTGLGVLMEPESTPMFELELGLKLGFESLLLDDAAAGNREELRPLTLLCCAPSRGPVSGEKNTAGAAGSAATFRPLSMYPDDIPDSLVVTGVPCLVLMRGSRGGGARLSLIHI